MNHVKKATMSHVSVFVLPDSAAWGHTKKYTPLKWQKGTCSKTQLLNGKNVFKISSRALSCSPNVRRNRHSKFVQSKRMIVSKKNGASTFLGWSDWWKIRPGLWIEALQKVCIHGAGYYALCQHLRARNTFFADIARAWRKTKTFQMIMQGT